MSGDFPGASLDLVKSNAADLVPDDPRVWWEQSFLKAREDFIENELTLLRAQGWDEESALREAKKRWSRR